MSKQINPIDDAWRRRKRRIQDAERTHRKMARGKLKGSADLKIEQSAHKSRLSAIDRVFLHEIKLIAGLTE